MIDPYRMIVINFLTVLLLGTGILFYTYVYPKRKINLLVLLIIISFLPLVSILRKGTYESGDLTLHSVFLRSFFENLEQGNLIPRWAGELCGGYGCPAHVFEYMLPFYIGSIFHFFGFSYVNSIKLLLAFSFVASGLSMYIFAKNEFGKLSGFVASILYLFAPFHLSETHFRVSVGMIVSFIWIPLIFYFTKKVIQKITIANFILNAICVGLLVLSHGNILLSIIPLIFFYVYFNSNNKLAFINKIIIVGLSFLLGFFYSAFYSLPVVKEVSFSWNSITQITSDFKPFLHHIVSPAMFGFLFQGHQGEFYPLIGYPHLIVVFVSILFIVRKRISNLDKKMLIYYLVSFFIMFFMLQSISKPIWDKVPLLNTFIIPWRLLIPIAFVTSLLGAIVIKNIQKKNIIYIFIIFTILTTILNWGNRKVVPEYSNSYLTHWSMYTRYYDKSDPLSVKIANELLPKAPEIVLNRPQKHLEIIKGDADYAEIKRSFIHHSYIIYAKSDVYLRENTFYFPGWNLYSNNENIPISFRTYDNNYGVMSFKLKKGLHKIDLKFENTPVRNVSEKLSFFAISTTIIVAILKKKKLLNSPKF